MKEDTNLWRRRALHYIAGCAVVAMLGVAMPRPAGATTPAAALGPLGPSDRPEAYFNGSSYIRLSRPISLKQIVGLSFRTCVGGELFSQRFEGYTLHVTALFERVVVSWARPGQAQREVALARATLDNRWHWLALRYRPAPPTLLLEVDRDTQVIANSTWHSELVFPGALEAGGAVVLVGNVFSGCIHEGPQLEFHAAHAQLRNVVFGHCPLTTDECKDRKDVLRIPPKDHCYNEPCMRHGTCISRHDRYECHCTARYSGNNCEVDAGDPCRAAACAHGAACREDAAGDVRCDCPPNYHGQFCELELSLDPVCQAGPCRNNGSCVVPPDHDTYVCVCAPGFTGQNCEIDVDECAGAGAGGACLNGGRCVDAVNDFTCDCSGTGYTGARCEVNVNECEERALCGHGACYDTYGGYVCACAAGYTGDHCQRALPGGAACAEEGGAERACPPRAHCAPAARAPNLISGLSAKVQIVCVCDPGYYGASGLSPNCSAAGGACAAGACLNGGACAQADDHFNCTCVPPYRGMYCETSGAGGNAGGSGGASAGAGKALSELQAERCAAAPCAHAASCVDTATGFHCECEAGWAGARCDLPAAADCSCLPHQECVESGGTKHCVPASAAPATASPAPPSACASAPCHNGTCIASEPGVARCVCPPGANGRFCELDIDECALMPKICNFGVCVNVPGSYQCYCRPGYTGDSCEQDIDECLSAPCKNGGTCQNLENNYECACMEGYAGKDCSVDINECESSPCASGATCVDGVASFSCVCGPGLTGERCQLDVDDCESAPCLNGGRCVDGVNSYSCDCAGTGFAGPQCGSNIDDCAATPCQHGGACSDLVNGFRCACAAGYSGPRCEVDIDECASRPCRHGGVCLQRSDPSLYRARDAPPAPVGPQPHMLLPAHFYQPFSYDIAAGFECVCVTGTVGPRCETNVDECASSPCAHGTCVDAVGGFSCDCLPGFDGELCAHEIDECASSPCARGRCVDLRADYLCVCAAGWGGRDCGVLLQGCRGEPCRHGGVCTPYLRRDRDHAFNCSCQPGFHGAVCEKITTMSLERRSFVEVNTTREEGYDISFRFKTTLGSALLAMGRGLTYFFLELSNGRLNLHSSLLNKWEGVFIGSNLNDSNWQKVFVTINSSHVVLAANEEQTIYPISQNEAYNASVTSFGNTRLGTAGSSYAALTHGPDFFVGCFQDVVVNSHWVLPEDSNATEPDGAVGEGAGAAGGAAGGEEAPALLRGVVAACPRAPQCEPNPCRAGGTCTDAWSTFSCHCRRPFLGHTCQYNYTAATFGHEGAARRSRVTVAVHEASRRAVRAALDISMFIRTREPSGHVFYLGSLPRYGQTDETLVAASLKNGELLVHLRFNHTPEDYTVGGTRLDNAHMHLIEVVRNSTLVQVKLNGTEYFRKSISAAKQLDAQVLYLGGPPPIPAPPTTPAPGTTAAPGGTGPAGTGPAGTSPAPGAVATTVAPQDDYTDEDFFKGVIQDVQVSNGVNVTIVQLFPLVAADVSLPPEFGAVSLGWGGVLPGVVSDEACASTPCRHGAACRTTWNDFRCDCPRGYKGKQCEDVEFCQLQGCPQHSLCRNLKQGYECVSNATFDGINTTLQYKLVRGLDPLAPLEPPARLSLAYRTKQGGTLLLASHQGSWFSVGVYLGRVTLQWKLGAALPVARSLLAPPPPAAAPAAPGAAPPTSHWTTLRATLANGQIMASFVEAEPAGTEDAALAGPAGPAALLAEIDVEAWQDLMTRGTVYLGGVPRDLNVDATEMSTQSGVLEYTEGEEFPLDNVSGEYFKGCMGEVRIGSLLLAYFSPAALWGGAGGARGAHYALQGGAPWGAAEGVGCVLCLDALCQWGGRCRDVRSDHACACPRGRAGDYCEIDIDECVDAACANGATCVDGAASYTCLCPHGFDGQLCENDIDECASSPCLNGGTCSDELGAFRCACAGEWRGPRCQERARRSCLQRPCQPPAACRAAPNPATGYNYTCDCTEGYAGAHCELAFCEATPCEHGQCRNDTTPPRCECYPGWEGARCTQARDECRAAGPAACQHRGRCTPRPPTYDCDCTDTGYTGARCETDVDECAEGLVSCGTGKCLNLDGSYTCICEAGYCGHDCLLRDPCYELAPGATAEVGATLSAGNATGPCEHGAACLQRCSATVDYVCHCTPGWTGQNCTEPAGVAAGAALAAAWWAWLLAALLGAALLAAAALLLAARARRQRASRGTYSPSGQEYRNPRALAHQALKPPPEERLI